MKLSFTSGIVYRCIVLATVCGAVAAGVSKGPGPSHVRSTSSPTATPTPVLCKKHSVQCCNATAESNSTAASTVLTRLGIDIPKKVVEIGINCTLVSDEEVRGGFCDESILCCHKVFNDTITTPDGKNTTVGVNCADVAL